MSSIADQSVSKDLRFRSESAYVTSLQGLKAQDKLIIWATLRILNGALFAFDLVSQPSAEHNRQQGKTKLPRADGLPKSMQCNVPLNHMVNAFRDKVIIKYAH